MGIVALLKSIADALCAWLTYKARREQFDLANAIIDRKIQVDALIAARVAAGDVIGADRLRDDYAAIAAAAGADAYLKSRGAVPPGHG